MTNRVHRLEQIRNWYNERYYHSSRQRGNWWQNWHKWLLRKARAQRGELLLDIGCGTGGFVDTAGAAGIRALGIDISQSALQQAKGGLGNGTVVCGAAEQLPFASKIFDIISALGSLEHCADIGLVLAEMHRVARDNARYLVVVPNAKYLGWWALRKGTSQQEIGELLLSRRQWQALFRDHGFSIQSIWPDWRPMSRQWISASHTVRKPFNIIKAVLLALAPLEYQYQFIFLLSTDK